MSYLNFESKYDKMKIGDDKNETKKETNFTIDGTFSSHFW